MSDRRNPPNVIRFVAERHAQADAQRQARRAVAAYRAAARDDSLCRALALLLLMVVALFGVVLWGDRAVLMPGIADLWAALVPAIHAALDIVRAA